jgi:hypothetical protein
MSEVERCPKCGGPLDKGYVLTDKSLAWDKVKPSFGKELLTFGDPYSKDSELLSPLIPYKIAAFTAARCVKCQIILFDYKSTGISAHR